MISHTTAQFRKIFTELPADVQRQARRAYRIFHESPNHPSLRFKPVHPTRPIYPARISSDYRAVGTLDGDEIIWYWIGSHADYNKLLSQSRRRP
ncbi:MAG: hypothetical protein OEN50_09450 [Deltaproteobacteria bacterium]|nr:hypothetical protein [Deltaproteobacteria bacterium]